MENKKVYTVIGLMSGTSLDGIDAALIKTDGYEHVEHLDFVSIPYDEELRDLLRASLGQKQDEDGRIARVEIEMTRAHAAAVDWLLSKSGYQPQDIDLIGFHGQTLFHDPDNHFTWQIGSGAMLARLTHIDVINDFRSADVAAGGQGAPLIPLYHAALSLQLEKPAVIVNIGGVANITYLGKGGGVIAFDTGPGNALIDDWVKNHIKRDYDENGLLARQGQVHEEILENLLAHRYFDLPAPKSLDRDAWDITALAKLSSADGAATLTEFTVSSILKGLAQLPEWPLSIHVSGGGRLNGYIMELLRTRFNGTLASVDDLGWNGDALEAEGFAYLAVRSLLGEALSLPGTTGVSEPVTGGKHHSAEIKEVAQT